MIEGKNIVLKNVGKELAILPNFKTVNNLSVQIRSKKINLALKNKKKLPERERERSVLRVDKEEENKYNNSIHLPNVTNMLEKIYESNVILSKDYDNVCRLRNAEESMKLVFKLPKKMFKKKIIISKDLVLKLRIIRKEKKKDESINSLKVDIKKTITKIPPIRIRKRNINVKKKKSNVSKMSSLLKIKDLVLRQNNEKNVRSILNTNVAINDVDEDGEEELARTMIKVPNFLQLKGHDCHPEILKAVMLLWENSGRGNFEQMQNILINDYNKNDNDIIEKNINLIKKEIFKEKLTFFGSE